MNEMVNKLLLVGNKFIPKMHLNQPQFTYLACGLFTNHKQRIQKFMQAGDTNYIYKNELDEACFQHGTAYSYKKDLTKRTVADKVLRDKAFNIATNLSHNEYEWALNKLVYKFFDKKTKETGIKNEIRKINS